MWNPTKKYVILAAVVLVAGSALALADPAQQAQLPQEAQLIAVLRSDATIEQKSAACRQLTRVATKEAVPALAALLGDEKLSHMARYALEPIRDPSVDAALRDALGKVKGMPRVGVIGSLGVRRDAKAVGALAGLLNEADAAQAAARALGSIGTAEAVSALEAALPKAKAADQLAICEGLLRSAESLAADGNAAASQAVYDRLRQVKGAPAQVRTAALRGAILARGADGAALLVEAFLGDDNAQAAAAARAALESSNPALGEAMVATLPKASPKRQGLMILALADRGDARVLPFVLQAVQHNDAQLRLPAFRALKRLGNASCVPVLLQAAADGDAEVSQAALGALESLQGKSVDEQLAAELPKAQGKLRLVLIDLVGRRRTAAAAPAVWQAADDADPAVRAAALTSLGAVAQAADLPKLIARLSTTKDDREAATLDKSLLAVCQRSTDREAAAGQLAAALPKAGAPVQARILTMLKLLGGKTALDTAAVAARSGDKALCDAGYRVLGEWKSVDAADTLLDLYKTAADDRLKSRAIRGYIRIARQFDMPIERRAEMCRTALATAERDDDKRLVLEVLLRYPTEPMQAIALEAAKIPALKEQASLVAAGMAAQGADRAELGKALAQAGHTPVKLEIVKAEYGAGAKTKDVTAVLRKYAKNYRIIFLPGTSFNKAFGGDPAPGTPKQLKIKYRVDGKEGETTIGENATIILPMPK